ncbi:MAG: hypothetical protein ACYDHH_18800 [Solirubrobacteraceae bacterium]
MIDVFDDTFSVDYGIESWQSADDPLWTWNFALEAHLQHTRRGVAAARIGTTRFHDSPQNNSAAVIDLLAHVLAVHIWLQGP